MEWFERFATEGLAFPAFTIAFGSLMILRASSIPTLTEDEIAAAPKPLRWLARKNGATLQRRCGWVMIACAVVVTIMRLAATR